MLTTGSLSQMGSRSRQFVCHPCEGRDLKLIDEIPATRFRECRLRGNDEETCNFYVTGTGHE